MKIGLIVPTYNRKEFTEQCFKTLQWSSPVDVVVCMVDDGSTDGWQEEWHPWQRDHEVIDHVILHQENQGLGVTLNHGIDRLLMTDADVIGWVNNDFLFEPGWDENIRDTMEDLILDWCCSAIYPFLAHHPVQTTHRGGRWIKHNDPGGAIFLLRGVIEDGIRPSTLRWQLGYVGPMPLLNRELKAQGHVGWHLASPGVLVRDEEYNRPEYRAYYDWAFETRGRPGQLARRRAGTDGRPPFPTWQDYLDRHWEGREP